MKKHFYLVRGLIREKRHWGNFIDHLQSEFPDALISTIDLPGAGDYFTQKSPLSVKEMVSFMRLDYLKLKEQEEHSHLIAVSLGGMIALEWMKTYPEDFQEATIINTSFGGVSPLFKRLLPSALIHLLKTPFLKGRDKEAHILKLVTNHEDIFPTTLDLWEKIHQERPVSLSNTLRQLLAGATFRVKEFTPPLPIQILASTTDRMVSVECSRDLAQKWNLPIEEHPTAGHDLTADDPAWVAVKIKLFAAN